MMINADQIAESEFVRHTLEPISQSISTLMLIQLVAAKESFQAAD